MRKCMIAFVFFVPIIGISLFAKPYLPTIPIYRDCQPAKIPSPVRECSDYKTTDGIIPTGCELYWFDALKGDTIGCTQYDRQWNMSPQKRIIFDPRNGYTHALWMHQRRGEERHMRYNCKYGGIWGGGQDLSGGTPVQEVTRDGYGDLDIDTAGLAVVSLHRAIGVGYHSAVYTDQVVGNGYFTELKDFPNAPGDSQTIWPMIAVDGKNNMVMIAHADSTYGQTNDNNKFYYRYSKDAGTNWSSWAVLDTFDGLQYNVFASKKSEKICITWKKDFKEAGMLNGHMMYKESENGGETFGTLLDAFESITTPSDKMYDFSTMKNSPGNVYGMYDSDDNIHLVTDAGVGSVAGGCYPSLACVIWHYSEAKGLHIVAAQPRCYTLAWPPTDQGWILTYPYTGHVMAKPTISEDPTNKYLYVAWVEFPYEIVGPAGYQSGEIYITYSMDGGLTWAPKLNLTMTPTECEVFATMAPVTNDTVRIFYEYDNSGFDDVGWSPAGTINLDTTNPMMYLEIPVKRGDVEAVGIASPKPDTIEDGTLWILIDSGATYSPKALYTNKGTTPISFQAKFEACYYVGTLVGDTLNPDDTLIAPEQLYYDIKDIENLAAGDTTIVHFKPWATDTLGFPGDTIWVSLTSYATFLVDTNLSNNFAYKSVGIEEMQFPELSLFTLSQPYPNPVPQKSGVNIQYSVPQTSYVSLRVYDITGKLVSTLVDKTCKAGTYVTNWNCKTNDGRTVPNGIYFYRLSAKGGSASGGEAGSYSATKKIVLLK